MKSFHMSKEEFLKSNWNNSVITSPDGKKLQAKIFNQPAEYGAEDVAKEEKIMQANAVSLIANKEIINAEFPEIVVPEGIITLWDEENKRNYYGVIKEAIEGVNLKDYIEDKSIPLEEKMAKVKRICELVERVNAYNDDSTLLRIHDVKAGNFIVTEDGLKMNADRVCTGYDKVPFAEYIEDLYMHQWHLIPEKYAGKYPLDENKKFIPSYALDVFGLGNTVMGALNDKGYFEMQSNYPSAFSQQKTWVDDEEIIKELMKKGYPTDFINAMAAMYDTNAPVINPLPFIDETTEIEINRRLHK